MSRLLALSLSIVVVSLVGCASPEPPPDTAAKNPESAEPVPQRMRPVPAPQVEPDLLAHERLRAQKQGILAAHYVTIGRRYLDEGRLEEAQRAFARALEAAPSNGEARHHYDAIAGLLGNTQAAVASEARQNWDGILARLDQVQMLAREHFRRGRHFHVEGDHDKAIVEYENAYILLDANPQIDADFDELRIKAAIKQAKLDKVRADRAREARRIREVHGIVRRAEERERTKVADHVRNLWRQAQSLYARGRYTECERLCEKITRLDPDGQVISDLRLR